jgi:hypothetical protein
LSGAVGTSVDIVSDGFVSFLGTLGALVLDGQPVQVLYGPNSQLKNVRIEIGDVKNWVQEWAGSGTPHRVDETYDLEFWIISERPGDAQAAATGRTMGYMAAIAMAARADVQIGLAGQFDSLVVELKPAEETKAPAAEGRASFAKAALHVYARI